MGPHGCFLNRHWFPTSIVLVDRYKKWKNRRLSIYSYSHISTTETFLWALKIGIRWDQNSLISVGLSREVKTRLSGFQGFIYVPRSRKSKRCHFMSIVTIPSEVLVSIQEPSHTHLSVYAISLRAELKGGKKFRKLSIKFGTQLDFSRFTEI